MIKRLKYFLLVETVIFSLLTMVLSPIARAHFLLRDTSTGIEASFHCAPDDDPIAGQQGTLSFDFSKSEKGIQSDIYDFTLTVRNETDETEKIPFEITLNDIIAKYTFPQQGLYTINLYIRPKASSGRTSTLEYAQRVSRGVVTNKSASKSLRSNLTVFIPIFLLMALTIVLIVREVKEG